MSRILSLTMLAEILRITIPYACAAVAGVWSERAGIVNIALEGVLLSSALGATVFALSTGSPTVGIVGGLLVGAGLCLVHGTLVAKFRIDAIVSGVALNIFAVAAARLVLRALYDSSSNSPSIAGFGLGPKGASGAALLGRVLTDPVTLLAVIAIVGSPWLLGRTKFGLHIRACGENPVAASSVGIAVVKVRLLALVVSGMVGALGGIHLAYDQHRFESGMSGGRGFIALAAVIGAGWNVPRAALACMFFAGLEALQIVLQDQQRIPHQLVQMLPYVATLVVLMLVAGRSRAPAGLGKHAT